MAAMHACPVCKYAVAADGDAVNIAERRWHASCWTCRSCTEALPGGVSAYERDELLYCAPCYRKDVVRSLGFDGSYTNDIMALDASRAEALLQTQTPRVPSALPADYSRLAAELSAEFSSICENPAFSQAERMDQLVWRVVARPVEEVSSPSLKKSASVAKLKAAAGAEGRHARNKLTGGIISHRIGLTLLSEAEERFFATRPPRVATEICAGVPEPTASELTAKIVLSSRYTDPATGNEVPYSSSEYAPEVFRRIRYTFNIADRDFCQSLCAEALTGGGQGAGKSGSVFYFSRDKKYVLKTISKAELVLCVRLLEGYARHLMANPHTLLPRFFALFKLTIAKAKPMRLVIMANVLYTKVRLRELYDLKGSTCDRFVTAEEMARKGVSVLKDMNLTQRVCIGPCKAQLLDQLQRDVALLVAANIMDFSMLLGIYRPDGVPISSLRPLAPAHFSSVWQLHEGGARGLNADGSVREEIYFFGMVDILQAYNVKKKVEHKLKIIKNKGNASGMSAVKTEFYAKRFLAFMDAVFDDASPAGPAPALAREPSVAGAVADAADGSASNGPGSDDGSGDASGSD